MFTFKKTPRPTGLASVGAASTTTIKVRRKAVGRIIGPGWTSKDSKWTVRFMVSDPETGGWKWVTLKTRFQNEAQARETLTRYYNLITTKLSLHPLEGEL